MAAIDLREEAFLAVEMVADAGDVHLRGSGELAHRHAIEAAFGEQPLACAQDALARSLLVLGGGRSHRASCDRLARCALRIRLVHALLAACRAANVNAGSGGGGAAAIRTLARAQRLPWRGRGEGGVKHLFTSRPVWR